MNPLKSDTINSLYTKYLHENGLADFTAHSTRGACVTALLKKGGTPKVIQQMGDWSSEVSFNQFYNLLRSTQAWQQVLVPDVGAQPVPHTGTGGLVATSSNHGPVLPT